MKLEDRLKAIEAMVATAYFPDPSHGIVYSEEAKRVIRELISLAREEREKLVLERAQYLVAVGLSLAWDKMYSDPEDLKMAHDTYLRMARAEIEKGVVNG